MEIPDLGVIDAIRQYFRMHPTVRARRATGPRGLRGILAYPVRRTATPAMSAGWLGEALAGLFMESKLGWALFERPQRAAPDAIMDAGSKFMLVEVKTTLREPPSVTRKPRTLPRLMMEATLDCLDIWAKEVYIHPGPKKAPGPYGALIFGIYIRDFFGNQIEADVDTLEIAI